MSSIPRGSNCHFAHGEFELKAMQPKGATMASYGNGPSAGGGMGMGRPSAFGGGGHNAQQQGEGPSNYKTQMCRHLNTPAGCSRGSACNFAHRYFGPPPKEPKAAMSTSHT